MKLHELIEASEPEDGRIETMFMSKEVVAHWVDRASYDRMKQIAVALAKRIEKTCYCYDFEVAELVTKTRLCANCHTLAKCRELLGEK